MNAFLIPGSGEDLQSRNYQAVLDVYKKHGYEPQFVDITWSYKTFDDWLDQVRSQISEENLAQSLLSGFSWGAMIALAVAAKIQNPRALHLYSLSPYFAEDMPLPKNYVKWAGKRRMENFKELSFNELVAQIHCPTKVFLGSKEKQKYADMWRRSSEARAGIPKSKLILVESVGHDVGDPLYVRAIDNSL